MKCSVCDGSGVNTCLYCDGEGSAFIATARERVRARFATVSGSPSDRIEIINISAHQPVNHRFDCGSGREILGWSARGSATRMAWPTGVCPRQARGMPMAQQRVYIELPVRATTSATGRLRLPQQARAAERGRHGRRTIAPCAARSRPAARDGRAPWRWRCPSGAVPGPVACAGRRNPDTASRLRPQHAGSPWVHPESLGADIQPPRDSNKLSWFSAGPDASK
jgi:hypothetical protein